jgi:hypothetical protein
MYDQLVKKLELRIKKFAEYVRTQLLNLFELMDFVVKIDSEDPVFT